MVAPAEQEPEAKEKPEPAAEPVAESKDADVKPVVESAKEDKPVEVDEPIKMDGATDTIPVAEDGTAANGDAIVEVPKDAAAQSETKNVTAATEAAVVAMTTTSTDEVQPSESR